jgi:hypothetical protein
VGTFEDETLGLGGEPPPYGAREEAEGRRAGQHVRRLRLAPLLLLRRQLLRFALLSFEKDIRISFTVRY